MTPDDVVARAKELEGREVLLTVRGVVERSAMSGRLHFVTRPTPPSALVVLDPKGVSRECLVSIEPAPLRIEPGELYIDGEGRVFVGRSGGRLFLAGWVTTAESWFGPGERNPIPDGLVRAKAVPA